MIATRYLTTFFLAGLVTATSMAVVADDDPSNDYVASEPDPSDPKYGNEPCTPETCPGECTTGTSTWTDENGTTYSKDYTSCSYERPESSTGTYDDPHGEYGGCADGPDAPSCSYERPECDSYHADLEARGRALQDRQRGERDELDMAWKGNTGRFSQANHTDEEWKAFYAEQETAYRELNARHAREWEELKSTAASTACVKPMPTEPACAVSYREKEAVVYDDKVRVEMERLHKLLEERRAAFEAELRAEYEEFMATGPTDEEAARFKANLRDRMGSFEVEQQAHLLEWKQRMAAEYGHYAERAGRACSGVFVSDDDRKPLPASASSHVRKHHSKYADWERQRLAFELEMRVAFADFLDAQNEALRLFLAGDRSDEEARRFHQEQEDERRAFEDQMRERMREFEERLRGEWESEVGDDLETAPRGDRFGSFAVSFDEEQQRIFVTGKYVAFEGDPATQAIGPHTVEGQLVLDGLQASTYLENFEFGEGEGGTALHVEGEGLRMSLHDHPSGLIKVHTNGGASVQLDFADYLDVERHGNGFRLSADGVEGILRVSCGDSEESPQRSGAEASACASEASLDETTNTVTFAGEGTFLLTSAPSPVLDKVANKHRKAVLDAVETGDVAAEVTLVAGEDALESEELEYGTVDVQVESTDLEARTASLLIESSEHEGKTIVVNLDKDGFGLDVALTFYELAEDGSESEAAIVRADSLTDVLDASDDETAEYWVVVDEDGTQVLVSIPHFSAKRLEIQGSAAAAPLNIVMIGFLAAMGVIAVAFVIWYATSRTPGMKK